MIKNALREGIRSALMEGEFTPKTCSTVMRLAEAARDFIRATSSKPEDFDKGTTHVGDADQPSALFGPSAFGTMSTTETFGAKMIREVIAAIPMMNQAKNDTPENLVKAIAAAEEAGLDDVSAALKVKLGVLARFPPGRFPPGPMPEEVNWDAVGARPPKTEQLMETPEGPVLVEVVT